MYLKTKQLRLYFRLCRYLIYPLILSACSTFGGPETFNRPFGKPPSKMTPPKGPGKKNAVKPLQPKAQLFSGKNQTCAVGEDGFGLYCWGYSKHGELGLVTKKKLKPRLIKGLPSSDPIVDVAFPKFGICVLLGSGYVMCWGKNQYGQIGVSKQKVILKPSYVDNLKGAARLIGLYRETCAILKTGQLYCWGIASAATRKFKYISPRKDNLFGLAHEVRISPTPIKAFSGHGGGACFIDLKGRLQCQGEIHRNAKKHPKLGYSTIKIPTAAKGILVRTWDIMSRQSPYAVLKNGQLWSWANCAFTAYCKARLVRISDSWPERINIPGKLRSAKSIALLESARCVLNTAGKVYCWGHCQKSSCRVPKNYKAPKINMDFYRGIYSIEQCLKMCVGPKATKPNGVECGLFCGRKLNYYLRVKTHIDDGMPITPAIQDFLKPYHFKSLVSSANGFCAMTKKNQVYCWGPAHYLGKKKKGPFGFSKISKSWW